MDGKIKSKHFIGIFVVAALLVIGIVIACFTFREASYNPTETVVVTIDKEEIYLDEVLYHVTLSRMQGQLYAAFMNDEDYMTRDYGDGRTMGEVMKQESMDTAIRYELLYKQALKDGYELTEDEIADSKQRAESILKTIPEEDMKSTGLTEAKIILIQQKIALATRYYQNVYNDTSLEEEELYEQIKEGHQIIVQKKVWNSVEF
ncbi:hypothetical protein [Anaerosporobacter sp.]|uniref:hypothetical protein n=1 Tax=Anaerosporobacter sp. TaxID=1872529 RepID=UPI00286F33AB|nr:hypothetical protein [Anaerosporobacter sp.]